MHTMIRTSDCGLLNDAWRINGLKDLAVHFINEEEEGSLQFSKVLISSHKMFTYASTQQSFHYQFLNWLIHQGFCPMQKEVFDKLYKKQIGMWIHSPRVRWLQCRFDKHELKTWKP